MSVSSPSSSLLRLQQSAIRELNRRGIEWPPQPQQASLPNDPVAFFRTVLKTDPWEKQEQILTALAENRRVAVRSCHHSGKTFAAGGVVHWFLHSFNPSLVITTAPTLRQVKDLLWYEIGSHHQRAGLPGELGSVTLEVSPTQRAFGFSTNEPERFQGWHEENILVVIDEASGVGEPIYQAVEGCLTGGNAKQLLIGNPNNPAGAFYEAFRSPLYATFHISAADIPERIFPGVQRWIEERRSEWGEDSPAFQVRVLGNFPDQAEDALVRMSWVEAAQQRELPAEGLLEVGVDVAEYGSDESVAYCRRGGAVVAWEAWRGYDPLQTAGRVMALAERLIHGLEVVVIKVDDIGIGAGTRACLKANAPPHWQVIGVNVGEKARDSEQYANLRTECFVGLAARFKHGEISLDPADTLLLDQLTQLRYTYTPKGQMRLTPKEEMRKTRGSSAAWQSPDRADALMLAFATVGARFLPAFAAGKARPA